MNEALFRYLVDTAPEVRNTFGISMLIIPSASMLAYGQYKVLQKCNYDVIVAHSPEQANKVRGLLISRLFIYSEHMCEVTVLLAARHRLARTEGSVLYGAFGRDTKWKELKEWRP